MHAKIDELRAEHDIKVANHRAESAEMYAEEAADFALDAISEAEPASRTRFHDLVRSEDLQPYRNGPPERRVSSAARLAGRC